MADSSDILQFGRDWCKKDDVRSACALLLCSEKPLSFSTESITKGLAKKVNRLVGVSRQEWRGKTNLLCEFECEVGEVTLPLSGTFNVSVDGGEVFLRIYRLNTTTNFKSRVLVKDIMENQGTSEPPTRETSRSSLSHAMSLCTVGGRKLRPFSGLKTPAKDEDSFDTWIELVQGQLEEEPEDCEKRRRLREALRPPAASIITDLRRECPQATADEYLAALELAFGSTESPEELSVLFHSTHQHRGESPSEFLTRLQGILRKLVRKGAAQREKSSSLLIEQFAKGVLFDEILLVNLRLKDLKKNPPSYLTLLQMVRREEAEQQAKMSRRGEGDVGVFPADPKQAKSRTQVAERPIKRKQNEARPRFCYRCGEEGHYKTKCEKPENLQKVNSQLIAFLQGNAKGRLEGASQKPKPVN
ncbi:paraneoplastic antigen Ma1 homolog [Patiria miniata]|uniref:CCHC-type domain-containing protein n=1 Tax=Patiria miniata TaxID=46514 RepID=A0A914B9A2_PATMI|nr:paraneoplastic antigen Ma1 homolog [Patiria miniata]